MAYLRPILMKTKSNLEASAPGRLPGRFSTIYNPLQQGGTMPSIEFISFDKEGKPKTKTFEGEHIKELLEDPSKPGQIVQELNQEEK